MCDAAIGWGMTLEVSNWVRWMMCLVAFLSLATCGFSQNSVTLGWDASPGASGYKVHYGTTSQNYPNTISGSATSATITNLTPGTTYYNSDWSFRNGLCIHSR